MFNWEQDPKLTERGIQLLLGRRYGGLRSFDGSGGDGGRDAELVTADGRTVFEVKSFGRLDSQRRRQVERSLKKAMESVPDMTRWVLVIPMNMTPVRPGGKSSEQAWFEQKLPQLAPGVDLDWFGLDWLDAQLAENMDVQRYIEGVDGQLLQRAQEFDMERAVLAAGAVDLGARLAGLERVVNEVSPYWKLDFAMRDGVQWRTLRAKTEDAHLRDPITITPTFTFRRGDLDDEKLRAEFEQTVAFGGHVHLPAGYVTDIDVEASEEARKLFQQGDPTTSEFTISTRREVLDRRIRCSYQVLASAGDGEVERIVSQFSVYLAERTSGARGATLYGSDPAGIATLEVSLPRPTAVPGPGEEITMDETPRLQLDLPESLVGYDLDSLLPVIRTLSAAIPGTRIRFVLPELGYIAGGLLKETAFPAAAATFQLVADLHRMQEVMGSAFTFPAHVTNGQAKELHRAVRQLDGEDVEHEGGLTLHLHPESVADFLQTLEDAPEHGTQGGLFSASAVVEFHVGDLSLSYGPSAFWAPHPRLANRTELEAIVADGETGEEQKADSEVAAEFWPTDLAFRWLSQERSASYFETGERPTELGA